MRHITVDVPVNATSGFTLAFLPIFFSQRSPGLESSKLRLRYPIRRNGDGMSVDRPVTIALRNVRDGKNGRALAISWSAESNAAYPRFSGHFATTALGRDRCMLSLIGSYVAPGGVAGRVFDAFVGRHIAQKTILGFLKQIATAVEDDWTIRQAM